MELVVGFITHTLLVWVISIFTQFWGWIVAGAVAVLGFLFSPTIRKYTIGAMAVLIIVGGLYFYGYHQGFNANHTVQMVTHSCHEFSKWLSGPPDQIAKIMSTFQRHGLCT